MPFDGTEHAPEVLPGGQFQPVYSRHGTSEAEAMQWSNL
jgi:hypothetical protein